MILTFAEDFSSEVTLDSQLLGTPESGLYFNRGVHPIVTVNNLLSLLPSLELTFTAYDPEVTYSKYEDSRKRSDVVTYEDEIYQSLVDSNTNHLPTDTDYWLKTNLESLKIKGLINSAKDNIVSAISLNRKLIENQYIYDVGEDTITLDGDYSGWVFEPKGSDYVKIRINQIALQTTTTDDVEVYVINQGRLIDTLTLTSNEGVLTFEDVGYTFYGKGKFYFVFESQEVLTAYSYSDALRYDGFICYPITGVGDTAADAKYSDSFYGNGMNFNITAYLDSDLYIKNNLVYLAKLYQAQFEVDFIRMVVSNANAESNNVQRILGDFDKRVLINEVSNLKDNTVAMRYQSQLRNAKAAINKTFDRFVIHEITDFEVDIDTI